MGNQIGTERQTGRTGSSGVFSMVVAASMWLTAGAGLAVAALRHQATLFGRTPESTSYTLAAAAETSSCALPGICW